MTEEIIIDGCNVAGCENYTTIEDCDGIHDLCEQLDDYCSIKKDCYYKQLKRLEQENFALTQESQQKSQTICELEQENKQMKSALEEINITVKQLLQGVSSNCINNTPYLTALSLIENKIDEVLGND